MAPKRLARTAGLFYLVLIVAGVFAHLVVRTSLYVPGDAAATAANIAAAPTLFRAAFVADLVMATAFLLVAFSLYRLLRHVNDEVARAMVVLVAISVAIICLNLLDHFTALMVATEGAYVTALGDTRDALVLLHVEMHRYGYLIAQVFFGLWLLPLAYLVHRSGMFPRALGILLLVGGVGLLTDTLVHFVLPGIAETVSPFLAIAGVGEFWLAGYLLVRGVKVPSPADVAPAAV